MYSMIALRIRRTSPGSNQFARVDPHNFLVFDPGLAPDGGHEEQYLYVPEKVHEFSSPGSRVAGFKIVVVNSPTFYIESIWPSEAWQKQQSMIMIDPQALERCESVTAKLLFRRRDPMYDLEVLGPMVSLSYQPVLVTQETMDNDPLVFRGEIYGADRVYFVDQDPPKDMWRRELPHSSVYMYTGFDGEKAVTFAEIRIATLDLL